MSRTPVVNEEVRRYLAAAQISEIPAEISTLRPASLPDARKRQEAYESVVDATKIWKSSDSDTGRLKALESYMSGDGARQDVAYKLNLILRGGGNQLPLAEIEYAMTALGLADAHNEVLTESDRASLDQEGYLLLPDMLAEDQLRKMQQRYDSVIEEMGADTAHTKGLARIADTVVKPMNRDGLLDPIFTHPKLLAAVRHVLGVHIKFCGSNYHAPLPGYGHQPIHADYMWGVNRPEVVNAVWLIDDFTEENGATRVVPGSHRLGIQPSGDAVNGKPRDTNADVEGQTLITGRAGSCLVYNAHLWHGGTQNCTNKLRRSQHVLFTRSGRPQSVNLTSDLDQEVYQRLGRVERAILDIGGRGRGRGRGKIL